MSCFVVSEKTIHQVIGWLNRPETTGLKDEVLQVAQINRFAEDWPDKLGLLMTQMNDEAYCTRYPRYQRQQSIYTHHWTLCSHVQAYKSLQCWLYQCHEGDIHERPLYCILQIVNLSMANAVISKLPEYDAAQWG